MELVSIDIPAKAGESTIIAPIGDIQWAGKRGPTALDTLKRHVDTALEMNAYFLGMGDYIDFMSPSNRQRQRAAALYDTAEDVIDDKALELVIELFDLVLKPTKGRWLGLLEGHHFSQLKTGDTTDQRLCQMLGNANFLGSSAFVRLGFNTHGTRGSVVIWCHHGVGGGQTQGAPLNKIATAANSWEGADIFIMGHTCKAPVDKLSRPYPRWHGRGNAELVERTIYLVNSGGFSKSYIVGAKHGRVPRGGYAEQGMMRPVTLGAPFIKINPVREYMGRNRSGSVHVWRPGITVEV